MKADAMKPMSYAHKQHVLTNGPNYSSNDDIACAAWLIENGYADGKIIKDFTRSGSKAANVIWRGPTDKRLPNPYFRAIKWLAVIIVPVLISHVLDLLLN